ncbi:hypothetical protein V490_01228 [Pseudogymnoascus sp. VKM F-3557]|nr:hypothetical protein V490_01228 [Pseudogymnoascus sp. VKM F-3557]
MAITEVLRATAAENDRLLKIMSETNYAPSAFVQSSNYVATLKTDIMAQEKLLRDTKATIAREEAEHKSYQTSHVKRLAYRIGGKSEKFEQQASKEEQDWVDAVHRGFEVQKKLDLLNQNLAEATKTSAEMGTVAATYKQAEAQLDSLYRSVFEGPTPDIPEEDQREAAVCQASLEYNRAENNVEKEKQVKKLLTEALKFLHHAGLDIRSARSSASTWGGTNTYKDVAEASSLKRVKENVNRAEMLVMQAKRMEPQVGDIGGVVLAQNNFVSNVLFNTVSTDMKKFENIKRSQESILETENKLAGMIEATKDRLEVAEVTTSEAKQALEERRLLLQQIRAEAYQLAVRGELVPAVPDGPPPSYQPPSYQE